MVHMHMSVHVCVSVAVHLPDQVVAISNLWDNYLWAVIRHSQVP